MTADRYLHAFRTFLGLPPGTDEPPICGATLTAAYEAAGPGRPKCPTCARLVANAQARAQAAAKAPRDYRA